MKSIYIENFKSIEEETINFERLTVLAGENGAGKSTVIQVLSLLKQSYDIKNVLSVNMSAIYLNDYYCQLGSFKEVLFAEASEDIISFSISSLLDEKITFDCIENKDNQNQLNISGKSLENMVNYDETSFLDSILEDYDFISADRYGPKGYHHLDSNFTKNKVGKYGEYTAVLLDRYKDDTVFIDASEAELSFLFGHIEVRANQIDDTNVYIMKMSNSKVKALGFKSPLNMPYGVSYVLPIIVSCLIRSSKFNVFKDTSNFEDGDIIDSPTVVIENPEAHLHPRAQSKLGEFLARMANDGVQIIIETHSDHIINGIRKAVKNHVIRKEDVLFNFFERGEELGTNVIKEIKINEKGKLSAWPKGFFDQMDRDTKDLI